MIYLYVLASIGIVVSFIFDKKKTWLAVKTGWRVFLKMLPMLLVTLILVSVVLFFLPDEVIAKYLGTSDLLIGVAAAALIGSVSLLPGFITFPLSGLLIEQGVSYTVIGAFTTSLMMVGIVTFPIERKYFGTKMTVVRNIAAFITALAVSMAIGLVYRELL